MSPLHPLVYKPISQKYRPQTFEEVIGQDAIVSTLKNALRLKRISSCYLFSGSHGTGKTTLARLFAKALNCNQLTQTCEPCNQCPSCKEVLNGHTLDIIEIDGASHRSIDDMRQIGETVGYAPARGRFKIYLIDEVHMLTKEAFNALLKTLEEPPAAVRFFFATTEPHKVLPTILSRCIRFDLRRVPTHLIEKKLSSIANDLQINIDQQAVALIAEIAEGAVRNAESLLDQISCYAGSASTNEKITADSVSELLGLIPRRLFFELDRAFSERNTSFSFELVEKIFAAGKDPAHFVERLIHHVQTLLLIKYHKTTEALHHLIDTDQKEYLHSANLYSEEQCLYLFEMLTKGAQDLTNFPYKRIALDMLLLNYLRSARRIAVEKIIERLLALESAVAKQSINHQPSCALSTDNPGPIPLSPQQPIHSQEKIAPPISAPIENSHPLPLSPHPETTQPPAWIAKTEEISLPSEKNQEKIQQNQDNALIDKAQKKSRYDTILRFAAVELEGTLN